MNEIEAIKQLRKHAEETTAALNTVIEAVHRLADIVQGLQEKVAVLSKPGGKAP